MPEQTDSFWGLFGKAPNNAGKERSFWRLFGSPPQEDGPLPCAVSPNPKAVFWAMQDLPVEEAPKHFMVCGAPGSGKTVAIRLFLQSIAPRFHPGASHPEQLIIFDAKCEVVPLLAGLGLRPEDENVWILNPFDERSAVWNLGEATQTPLMARALATLLVPEEPHATARYFSDAARDLVYAVLLGLNAAARTDWTFRDLICALDSREHIAQVTSRHPRARRIACNILNDTRHSAGVISTVATKLGHFEQVAALWHTNVRGRPFSVAEFLKRPGVLVLGNDPMFRESFWPINAMLLKALSREIQRCPETRRPRFWIVLDEFRAMGKIDSIPELLVMGRSKGACVMLGIQSIEGLTEVYGEPLANEILSACASKTFLRCGSPQSGEWAERFFNKVRRIERVVTETSGISSSTSVQEALQDRSLFLASYFLDLPFPSPGSDYMAVCDLPSFEQTLIVQRSFDEVLSWLRDPGDAPNIIPRDDADEQMLIPWTQEEEARFCAPAPEPEPKDQDGQATTADDDDDDADDDDDDDNRPGLPTRHTLR